MFLIVLALLPAIALVVWIYRQDKVEKEPGKLLWKIFFLGVLSVILEDEGCEKGIVERSGIQLQV